MVNNTVRTKTEISVRKRSLVRNASLHQMGEDLLSLFSTDDGTAGDATDVTSEDASGGTTTECAGGVDLEV
jgi:hypothetical protein